jgi:hypothetical protein
MSTFAEEEPLRTDAQVNLAVLQLHLHLPGPARALDQLERLAAVLRVELEQGGEEVLAVPSYPELAGG